MGYARDRSYHSGGDGGISLLYPREDERAFGWRAWHANEPSGAQHCICLSNGTHVVAVAVHLEGGTIPFLTPAMKTSKVALVFYYRYILNEFC